MSKEEPPIPHEPFEFTERERLFDHISHARLQTLLHQEQTLIHEVELSNNSFGEFLFVTLSYPKAENRDTLTFYGLGFHEYRERWITNTWAWYESSRDTTELLLEKAEALKQIEERRAEIASYQTNTQQSQRVKLYEMLADLTDEDGALTELEDLGDLFDFDDL